MKKILFPLMLCIIILFTACQEAEAPELEIIQDRDNQKEQITEPDEAVLNSEEFVLTHGQPPTPDPEPIIYMGNVEISGWLKEEEYYSDTATFFYISDQSLNKIPDFLEKRTFFFGNSNKDELIKSLEPYNEENPAKLIVEKLSLYQDGTRLLYVKDVIE